MFRFIALLPILSVAAHTGNSFRLARQTTAADCTTPCKALTDSLPTGQDAGNLASICTNTIASNYQACYSCEVKTSAIPQQSAQQTIDAYVNGCKAGGHPVNSITISGDGNASAPGGGSAPAASGAAPAASGASGTPAKTGAAVRMSTGLLSITTVVAFVTLGMVI
ncbi:hypothetical protein MVEN_02396300 [Mycena venus]|uniref:Uncharacterized protein n=1 Tax=Mycena venus TaxID=2733690 RepID=A0A8H7CEV1_9AGAR|nr:hypothetical protein MVEN_02396300 [Mycena venus]